MGGKKKGGKKGAKIVDGISTSEMSRDQLLGHVRRMQVELDREREERNFFMLEREKLFALWNIAMEQLHAQKVKTRLAVEQMAENDEEKQMEVRMHKQKLRFLLTEQSKRVDEGRLENLKKLQKAQDDMMAIQSSLKESVNQKNKELRQAQEAMHELLRQMKLENAKNISQVRNETSLEVARLERDFLRMNLEREKKDEIAIDNERELVKNKHSEHMEYLKELHSKELENTKSYFHEILVNNLATIKALQEEIKELKESERTILKNLEQSNKEIRKVEERIRAASEDGKRMAKQKFKMGDEIKKELKKIQETQKTKDKYTRSVEIANEALLQKVGMMEGECKAFKNTVTRAILEMQQEAAMKRMILDLKLKVASENMKQAPKWQDDKEGTVREEK